MSKREFRIKNEYRYNRKNPLRWIFSHLLRYPYIPLLLLVLSISNNWAQGSISLLLGKGFNIMTGENWHITDLVRPTLLILTSTLVVFICGLSRNGLFELLAQLIEKNSREEFYISLLGKSQTFHNKQKVGDLMARATGDVRNLNTMFNPGLMLIIDALMSSVIPVVMIGLINPMLLPVPLLFLIFLSISVRNYNKRLKPVSLKQREQNGKLTSELAETIEGIEIVKANIQENYEFKKFTRNAGDFRDFFIKQGIIQAKYWPLLIFAVFLGLAFLHAIYLYRLRIINMGEIIAFIDLFFMFKFSTFISLFSFNLVQLGMASAKRLLELMNTQSELDENRKGHKSTIKGSVTFNNVHFGFDDKKTISNVSFNVSPGETVAIVGQTGSGKTTLTRLINRIFEANSGEVSIDDINVKEWNLESLRSQISTIEQDIFLFSRSIRDNISFGNPGADFEAIKEAARKAQAEEFILNFKDGYDTVIGERGVTLSGGQKQRIAIARAFLASPKILILDDSTSAIDSATEYEIQKAMKKISARRTTFIITHRLSQIRWADKILVLKKGELVDQGNHDELISRSKAYKKIFAAI